MNTLTAGIHSTNPRHNRPVDRCTNTGRVLIGIAHVPRANTGADSMTRDALRIQSALIGAKPKAAQAFDRRDCFTTAASAIAGAALVCILTVWG